ncbi:PCMD domain-containing protein, partial [Bacteroides thetaiotaomicron]|uniref:PCMD domain-containing protein n=1 Tax=Bacteroides thetaiotaomicron TaxID=818 RepID=UPI001C37D2F8
QRSRLKDTKTTGTLSGAYAVAALSDKTAKVDYTYFEIPFEFLKDYEEGAKYKLAIVCSSSKEGDLFKGAGGSTLILDELEVMGE